MARPRTPLNIIKMRGSDKVNPGRFKDRENQMQPESIGRVPNHLKPEYKKIWKEIANHLPAGTIAATDRIALETLCKLIFVMRFDFENMTAAQLGKLESLLGRFGMTPSDRSKVIVPKKTESSAWDEL